MGATCCTIGDDFKGEINDFQLVTPSVPISSGETQIPKELEILLDKPKDSTNYVCRVQAKYRGRKSRLANPRPEPFSHLTIIKYISQNVQSSQPAVKKIEDKLGAYILTWDVFSCRDKLELRPLLTDMDGSIYHGYWNKSTNNKEGYGQQVFQNGTKYEGFWREGLFEGEGRYIYENGDYYYGNWLSGNASGKGNFIGADGITYNGEWLNNLHHGHGFETWADGSKYEGEYVDGKKEGKGKFTWADKTTYEGEFKENLLSGKGIYTWTDGRSYEGDWLQNVMHGRGTFFFADGRKYEGGYSNDLRDGHGIMQWPDGRRFDGMWKNGKMNGKGTLTLVDGNVREGIWEDGIRIRWMDWKEGTDDTKNNSDVESGENVGDLKKSVT